MNFSEATASTGSSMGTTILIVFLFAFALYMLQSIIALAKRNHRTKVILFNIFSAGP